MSEISSSQEEKNLSSKFEISPSQTEVDHISTVNLPFQEEKTKIPGATLEKKLEKEVLLEKGSLESKSPLHFSSRSRKVFSSTFLGKLFTQIKFQQFEQAVEVNFFYQALKNFLDGYSFTSDQFFIIKKFLLSISKKDVVALAVLEKLEDQGIG